MGIERLEEVIVYKLRILNQRTGQTYEAEGHFLTIKEAIKRFCDMKEEASKQNGREVFWIPQVFQIMVRVSIYKQEGE